MTRRRPTARRGFTLVELMVAVIIGLIVTLAASRIVIDGERGRRVVTSANDVNQTAAYLAYSLDRTLRSAGSGFTQRWRETFGCPLATSLAGATILPRGSAFPAPFAALPATVRIAPAIIHAGASPSGSDVLAVMTGQSGYAEAPVPVLSGSVTASNLRMRNTLGHRGGDLVMLVEPGFDCMLQQVATGFVGSTVQQLDFGGSYAASAVNGVNLAARGATGSLISLNLGNSGANNAPQFQLLGVGDNDTLFAYDLLRIANGDTPTPVSEGVAELRALYGVDSNDDGVIDTWQNASATPWDAATLLNGSGASSLNLRRIHALRVGIVLRSTLVERDTVAPASLTLFEDLPSGVQVTHTVATAQRARRHRGVEFTVPLRNVLLLPLT